MIPLLQQNQPIILASGSPRRAQLLKEMGFDFEVITKPIDESFPSDLKPLEIAEYLAEKKSEEFCTPEYDNYLLITADTIVAIESQILNKPSNFNEASQMLKSLSGSVHEVITGVCLRKKNKTNVFHEITQVEFCEFTNEEIGHYINAFQPFDKAGSYGIQEWIGHVGVKRINGSYTNVVGLPTARLYSEIKKINR